MVRVSVKLNLSGLKGAEKAIASLGGGKGGGGGKTVASGGMDPAWQAMLKQWALEYSAFLRKRFNALGRGAGFGGDTWPPLALSTVISRLRRGKKKDRKITASDLTFLGERTDAKGKTTKFAKRDEVRVSPAMQFRLANRGAVTGDGTVAINRKVSILRDTGSLFGALAVDAPGNINQPIPGGLRFGIGGSVKGLVKAIFTTQSKSGREQSVSGVKTGSATLGQIAAWHDAGAPGRLPRRQILAKPAPDVEQRMAGYAEEALRSIIRRHGR